MDETCAAYLYSKIDLYAKSKYNNLGFITDEDIRKDILNANFKNYEVQNAITFCLNQEKLDLYYKIQCPNCNEDSHILEREYSENSTFKRLKKDGFLCDYCNERHDIKNKDKIDIERKYCISHKELSK